jgi:hypothetical protein
MGRDSWQARQSEIAREERKRVNPIWRGVGCMLMFLLVAGGYLFANWFINQNNYYQWVYIPQQLIYPSFAPWLPPGILVSGSVALIFLVLSYIVISIAYSIAFPIKPGEFDVEKPQRQRRRER